MHRRRKWRKRQKHNFAHKIERNGKKKRETRRRKEENCGRDRCLAYFRSMRENNLSIRAGMNVPSQRAYRTAMSTTRHTRIYVFLVEKKKEKKNRFWEKSSSDSHAHMESPATVVARVFPRRHTPIEGSLFADVTYRHTVHENSMLNAGISVDTHTHPFALSREIATDALNAR